MPAPQRPNARPDIWFAQTIEQQQKRQLPVEDRSFLPSVGLFALPTCLCVALFIAARPNGAQSQANNGKQNRPANPVAARSKNTSSRLVVAQNTVTTPNGPTVEPPSEGGERLPLTYYTSGIRGSMFGAPVPPPPKPVTLPPPRVETPPPAPPVVVAPVDPFADWAYTGTIRMGEETIALLENTKTKEGQYVKAGDRFLGTEVTAVSDQEVSVGGTANPSRIAKSDSITVTQLDKSAPFLAGGGQPGQPGQPGMPGGMPGQPGGRPGMPNFQMPGQNGTITLPNGRTFNPQDMERMRQQFLDNRFNRGRGGNNDGGNGGGFNFNGGGGRSTGDFSGRDRGRRNRDR